MKTIPISRALVIALLGTCCFAVSAAADTINLHIVAYCHTINCGYSSPEEFKSHMYRNVFELNNIFKPTGIAFRPQNPVVDIIDTSTAYAFINKADLDKNDPTAVQSL